MDTTITDTDGQLLGTVAEAAAALSLSEVRVRDLCQKGRIVGARQMAGTGRNGRWLIPMPPSVTYLKPGRPKKKESVSESTSENA